MESLGVRADEVRNTQEGYGAEFITTAREGRGFNPAAEALTPRFIQQLKQHTAYHVLQALRENSFHPWRRKMLARFRLPETVHDEAHYRVWQRRYYAMNIFTAKKRLEKLNYMHGNPVKHGLVTSPDKWPWSSFRFYYLEDASVLRMDRLD